MAIELSEVKKKKGAHWKCICDCGKIKEIASTSLISGLTNSCGCLKREITSERRSLDLNGKIFGRLSVIEKTKNRSSNGVLWKCLCSCGNIIEVAAYDISSGHTTSCGCKRKETLSLMSGTNHPNWTGTTNLNHYLRASILDDWKNKSLFSFKYKCIISNTSKDLIVHHLYPFASIINETVSRLKLNICNDISLYSEYELENLKKVCAEINFNYGLGVPLNKEIHNKFHSIYGKKNFTPENFQEFFYLETNKEIDLVNMNIKEVV